jgi:uncharacterized protein (TIGR00255 family)
MTGYGEAHRSADGVAVSVEVRSINSRYFKLTLKSSEGYGALEAEIEQVIRQQIRRGTMQVTLQVQRAAGADAYRLDAGVLASYQRQLEAINKQEKVPLASLLGLPGVVAENALMASTALEDWPLVRDTLLEALEHMAAMRADEGRAMAADLRSNCAAITTELGGIDARAPLVAESYRARLEERLKKTLAEYEVSLQPGDLVKEISIYAERSDISEEIVRLKSHLDQFEGFMRVEESAGRKLEFLTQEMFREANTIGSKANDVQISRHVIEIKAAIERIKEMIQNVE